MPPAMCQSKMLWTINTLILLCFFQWTTAVRIQPDNTFSAGRLNYRTLLVDTKSTSLYVGGRNSLFKLWIYNINDTSSPTLYAKRMLDSKAEERQECLQMGHSEENCDNWVRQIFLKSNGQLIVCSSDAVKPRLHTLEGAALSDTEYPKTIIGICSPQADLNATAVYVEFGNPDDIPSVYSGIRTGLALENHLIYRPPLVFNNKEQHPALRTVYTDFKWLNEPQFVGSFNVGQYVYFFFREIAVEAESCGRHVYSRVARICKNDLGGKNVLRQVWSSFVKARLNCSMAAQSPFHFNFIQSVSMAEVEAETLFYATFTSSDAHFQSSAICSFSLGSINQVFDSGVFLEQPTSNSAWIPTSPDRVPAHRPGSCSNSQKLSDEELHFTKSHLLLADSVPSGGPLFTLSSEPLTTVLTDVRGNDVVIFVLNPHSQTVHKIVHWREQQQGRLIASYRLGGEERVRTLALLPGEYLFVADDARISQYRVGQCPLHALCHSCASDPYCSWNIARAECFARDSVHSTAVGWITNVQNSHRCESYVKSISKHLYPGDGVILPCPSPNVRTEWMVDRKAIPEDSDYIQHTTNGGIVLLNVTNEHSGTYQCLQNGVPVAEYSVVVDDKDCSRPKTVQQFHSVQREWCKKYDFYKSNLSKWQRYYDENNECPRIPPEMKINEKQKSIKFL